MLQPSSIDVRLDRYFRVFQNSRYTHIDPAQQQDDLTSAVEPADDEPFVLHPGEFVLGSTFESVSLPDDLAGRLEGKSSLGRLGLLTHSTAGFIDPGFSGHITLELSNVANLPITLWPGMKIGQLCLFRLSSPAERPYGSEGVGSRYQGQRGPDAVPRAPQLPPGRHPALRTVRDRHDRRTGAETAISGRWCTEATITVAGVGSAGSTAEAGGASRSISRNPAVASAGHGSTTRYPARVAAAAATARASARPTGAAAAARAPRVHRASAGRVAGRGVRETTGRSARGPFPVVAAMGCGGSRAVAVRDRCPGAARSRVAGEWWDGPEPGAGRVAAGFGIGCRAGRVVTGSAEAAPVHRLAAVRPDPARRGRAGHRGRGPAALAVRRAVLDPLADRFPAR